MMKMLLAVKWRFKTRQFMKKNIAIMLCFVGATMLTACSYKEDTTGIDGGKITINAEQFTLTEKGYGEETDVTTRAAVQ